MPSPIARTLVVILLGTSLAACTAEGGYYSAQAWQRNECNRIPDASERERCLSRLGTSYDQYKRESESLRKP